MITSRRSFIAGIAAAFAAPAIVRASSLMPVRAYSDELITRCDILYGHLDVRAEWLGLDEFTDRIMGPRIKRFQQSVADEIMNKSMLGKNEAFFAGPQWEKAIGSTLRIRLPTDFRVNESADVCFADWESFKP